MKALALTAALLMIVTVGASIADETVAPLAMSNAAIGGAAVNQYTPGVEKGEGLNNIGLLIRTWGKVTAVDTTNKFFYINDGSGRTDGSGNTGVRVSYDNLAAGNAITPPSVGQCVTISGISSTVSIAGKVQPNLRPRRQSDIQTVSP